MPVQFLRVQILDVLAVDQHLPFLDVVETADQVDECRLPGPALSDNSYELPRFDAEIDILQHRGVLIVAEMTFLNSIFPLRSPICRRRGLHREERL